ncbi:plectin-like [Notolabrus celidotus]|uniref:plectin-like n=1 Tax=Notolabrus celidotus TaxID=1203425 RepID=UPI00148FD164|nr:plectin-like [Notolabrus celidotus]
MASRNQLSAGSIAVMESNCEKEGDIQTFPKPILDTLQRALLSAQETIKRLKGENSRLASQGLTISESQAEVKLINHEREKMRETIKKMDKDFHDERKALQDLNREQLEEILNQGSQLLVYQSRDNQCEEKWTERVRQLEEEVETSRRAMEKERICGEGRIETLQEGMQNQAKVSSSLVDLYEEKIKSNQDNAATELRQCEEWWMERVSQLEEEVETSRRAMEKERICGEGRIETLQEGMQNQAKVSSSLVDLYEEKIKSNQDNAATELRQCEEWWMERVSQLEEEVETSRKALEQERLCGEGKIMSLQEGMQNQAKVSTHLVDLYEEKIRSIQDNAATELRQCEERERQREAALQETKTALTEQKTRLNQVKCEKSPELQKSIEDALKQEHAAELSAMEERCKERISQEEGHMKEERNMAETLHTRVRDLEEEVETSKREFTESITRQAEENSSVVDLYKKKMRSNQNEAATELRQCEERWQERERQMESALQETKTALTEQETQINELKCALENNQEHQKSIVDTLKQEHAAELSAIEERCIERIGQEERHMEEEKNMAETRHTRVRELEKEVETSRREITESRKRLEEEKRSLEESMQILKQENSAHFAEMVGIYKEEISSNKEDSATKLRECEERWTEKVEQLQKELKTSKRTLETERLCAEARIRSLQNGMQMQTEENSSLVDLCEKKIQSIQEVAATELRQWQERERQMESALQETKTTLTEQESRINILKCALENNQEHQKSIVDALKQKHYAELSAIEERCNERISQEERHMEEEKNTAETRHTRVRELEEEVETSRKEFTESITRLEEEKQSLVERLQILKKETSARLAEMVELNKAEISSNKEDSATKLRECEKRWTEQVEQLEEEVETLQRRLTVGNLQIQEEGKSVSSSVDPSEVREGEERLTEDERCLYEEEIRSNKEKADNILRRREEWWTEKLAQLEEEMETLQIRLHEGRLQIQEEGKSASSSVDPSETRECKERLTEDERCLYEEKMTSNKEKADTELKQCEERWTEKVEQLEGEVETLQRRLTEKLLAEEEEKSVSSWVDVTEQRERNERWTENVKNLYEEKMRANQEKADTELRQCEERVRQLEGEVETLKRGLTGESLQIQEEGQSASSSVDPSAIREREEQWKDRQTQMEAALQTSRTALTEQQAQLKGVIRDLERSLEQQKRNNTALKREHAAEFSALEERHNEMIIWEKKRTALAVLAKVKEEQKEEEKSKSALEEKVETSRKALEEERNKTVTLHTRVRELGEEVETLKRGLTEESQKKVKSVDHPSVVDPSEIRKCEKKWTERVRQLEEEVEMSRVALERLRLCSEGRVRSLKNGIQSQADENSSLVDLCEKKIRSIQEVAADELRMCQERWQVKERQLEEALQQTKTAMTEQESRLNILKCALENNQEHQKSIVDALKQKHYAELSAIEERCNERISQEERHMEEEKNTAETPHTRVRELEEEVETSRKEFTESITRLEEEKQSLVERLQILKKETSARLAEMVELNKAEISSNKEDSATKLKECEKRWTEQVEQLEEEVETLQRRLTVGNLQIQEEGKSVSSSVDPSEVREGEERLTEDERCLYEEKMTSNKEKADTELKQCEERWTEKVEQLEGEVETLQRRLTEKLLAEEEEKSVSSWVDVTEQRERNERWTENVKNLYEEKMRANQEKAATELRQCEERVRQLEGEVETLKRGLTGESLQIQEEGQSASSSVDPSAIREREEQWKDRQRQMEAALQTSRTALTEQQSQLKGVIHDLEQQKINNTALKREHAAEFSALEERHSEMIIWEKRRTALAVLAKVKEEQKEEEKSKSALEEKVETSRKALEEERNKTVTLHTRLRELWEEVETLKRGLTEESQKKVKSVDHPSVVDPSEIRKCEKKWTERVRELEEEVEISRIALERLRLCSEGRVRSLKIGIQSQAEEHSSMVDLYEKRIRSNQIEAADELRMCQERWQVKERQLEEALQQTKTAMTEQETRLNGLKKRSREETT